MSKLGTPKMFGHKAGIPFLELSPARSYFPPELEPLQASGIPLGEGRSDRPLADRREDGFVISERIA
jgi:hypothetical protein